MRSTFVRRQIGALGTGARAVVGVGLLAWQFWLGVDALDAILGFVAFPAAVLVGLALLRRGSAPPLRAGGPAGHAFNIVVFLALVSWEPDAAFLFYGASMLIAALRGFGACEIFAVSNLLRRRDDQLGCPLFLPIDLVEARLTNRELYCP